MEALAREMLDTIEAFKAKADQTDVRPDGRVVSVQTTRTPSGGLLYLYLPPRSFSQPPLELEEGYGFRNLAGHYKMPDGITAADLQSYGQVMLHAQMRDEITNREMQQKLQRVIDRLTELNPQLKELRPDPHDFDARYDTVLGIASDFNVKDMNFWLSGNTGTVAQQNPVWNAMETSIIGRGIPLKWVASMDTLQSVDAQLNQREAMMYPARRRAPAPGT